MALAPTAATITVRKTLGLLDGPFLAFADGVAENRYALWLGSGISFGRVDGLKKVVPRVVEFLRSQIAAGDPGCRFKKALEQAIELAQLSDDEKGRLNLARPFSHWPDADVICNRLVDKYSRLLDIQVDGEPDDYILWSGVNIVATFADPNIEPDVEHLCIGILILEGVSS
ncbi:MAG: SIR2 family protein, partial [Deltaproteobacteria bacterium]|nr:SIR2 family protein [Deltaproteobacteria bacterium]